MRELAGVVIGFGLCLLNLQIISKYVPWPTSQNPILEFAWFFVAIFVNFWCSGALAVWLLERLFPPHDTKAPSLLSPHDTKTPTPLSLHDTYTLDLNLEQDRATLQRLLQGDATTFGGYPLDWDDLRRQVLQRDGYQCGNCGRHTGTLHVHHIVPLSRGGTNNLSNLRTLCEGCHTRIHPHMR